MDGIKAKETNKHLLELKKLKRQARIDRDFESRNLINSGAYQKAIGLLEKETNLEQQLVEVQPDDAGLQKNLQLKPPLFLKNKRYIRYWKLEQIFRKVDFEQYNKIAVKISLIPKQGSFHNTNTKNLLLGMLKTFNKKSAPLWHAKLRASRDKMFHGLKLVPQKHLL